MSSICEKLELNKRLEPYPSPFPDHCYFGYYTVQNICQEERETYPEKPHQQHHKCPVFRVATIHKFRIVPPIMVVNLVTVSH